MLEITTERIFEIVNTNIKIGEATSDKFNEDLQQLGMDSLGFIRIIVSLEEEFEIEIPDSYLIVSEMNTINKMLNVLTSIKA